MCKSVVTSNNAAVWNDGTAPRPERQQGKAIPTLPAPPCLHTPYTLTGGTGIVLVQASRYLIHFAHATFHPLLSALPTRSLIPRRNSRQPPAPQPLPHGALDNQLNYSLTHFKLFFRLQHFRYKKKVPPYSFFLPKEVGLHGKSE